MANIGFINHEAEEKYRLVPKTQDPYNFYRGEWVNVEYPHTRAIGNYVGLDQSGKLVLSPHIRGLETHPSIRDKNARLILEEKPLFVSLDGVATVGPRNEDEIKNLIDADSLEYRDPSCLI